MRTIYKFALNWSETVIQVPVGSNILHVGNQNGLVHIWVEVDAVTSKAKPALLMTDRTFYVIGTGNEIPDAHQGMIQHVGTVQISIYVWHVYERIR